MVGSSNQSVPEMAIERCTTFRAIHPSFLGSIAQPKAPRDHVPRCQGLSEPCDLALELNGSCVLFLRQMDVIEHEVYHQVVMLMGKNILL